MSLFDMSSRHLDRRRIKLAQFMNSLLTDVYPTLDYSAKMQVDLFLDVQGQKSESWKACIKYHHSHSFGSRGSADFDQFDASKEHANDLKRCSSAKLGSPKPGLVRGNSESQVLQSPM
jgi:hypothetical protein